jgi:hypothetical protein
MTCKTCVDYTNRLADITVGYMGGDGDQWLVVRNDRGAELLALLGDRLTTRPLTDKGKRQGAVRGFLENTARAAGGMPLRRMPDWLRPLVSFLQPRIGPRGLEFARARVEMKAVETVLHLRRALPARMKNMIPPHVWRLVAPYGLTPTPDERRDSRNPLIRRTRPVAGPRHRQALRRAKGAPLGTSGASSPLWPGQAPAIHPRGYLRQDEVPPCPFTLTKYLGGGSAVRRDRGQRPRAAGIATQDAVPADRLRCGDCRAAPVNCGRRGAGRF